MLHMVQVHYLPEARDQLRRHCERCGVTGYGVGVTLKGAWVSASRHGFLLFDADDEEGLREACAGLSQFGDVSHLPVISIDQIM